MADPRPRLSRAREGTSLARVTAVALAAVAGVLALTGCASETSVAPTDEPSAVEDVVGSGTASDDDQGATGTADQRYPDIVAATLVARGDGTYDVEVTVSSPYDTPERYADGWRVLTADAQVLGVHALAHDHANEQPFTRTQRGLVVPEDVTEVTVQGRDLANGFGGGTLVVAVPR